MSATNKTVEQQKQREPDGRHLRTERSRQAFIDEALALVRAGVLEPTAQQVAERTGVGVRTFFRHFADMEALFAAADKHIRQQSEARFLGGDREGSPEERIVHVIERRANAYEIEKYSALSVAALSWRYDTLRKNYARYQHGLRIDLDDWLPELKKLPRSRREALDAATSFEMWHRLRVHQGVGKAAAIEILIDMVTDLMPVQ